jgi:hypothetical protein
MLGRVRLLKELSYQIFGPREIFEAILEIDLWMFR